MMEQSSRFISLSGLSGIFAGLTALAGAAAAFLYLNISWFSNRYYEGAFTGSSLNVDYLLFFFCDGIIVLFLALLFGVIFTVRNARNKNIPIWGTTTKLLLVNLFIPLVAGGLFVLILLYHQLVYLVAPATLIFYGLALLNASKFTFKDVRYLGLLEIFLGLVSSIYIGYGLLFWAIGFGVLHIIYGAVMYFKYER